MNEDYTRTVATPVAGTPGNTHGKRIHPLMAGAAIALIIACLTGVAAMTGLIPNSHSTTAPIDNTASTAPAAPLADPKPVAVAAAKAPVYAPPPPQYAPAPAPKIAEVCYTCGHVESVHAVQHAKPTSGVGIGVGAVVGGLLGNQIGNGNGRTLATVAGAVGGGYAGNVVERRTHTTTTYEVNVRMENGKLRSFPESTDAFRVGEPVRVVDGHLTSRG